MAKPKRSRKIRKPKTEIDLNAALDALGPIACHPAGRIAWWRERTAIIDRHRRRSRITDVDAPQERNWPTVEIAVDDPEATRRVRRNITRVRQAEAWRHNRLSSMQRDAERELELAWRSLTSGLGASRSKLMFEPRGHHDSQSDVAANVGEVWREWHREAGRRGINQRAVIDVLAEPKTLAQVERDRRLRRGQAFAIYSRAMDLWAELRGWMRRPPATIGLEARA
jgi:hypothetical protein